MNIFQLVYLSLVKSLLWISVSSLVVCVSVFMWTLHETVKGSTAAGTP